MMASHIANLSTYHLLSHYFVTFVPLPLAAMSHLATTMTKTRLHPLFQFLIPLPVARSPGRQLAQP